MSLFPLFLVLYEFVAYLSTDMYMPAFPFIAKYFGTHDAQVQATYTSWLAGGAFAQIILGPLSDRYGRRPILFYGGLAFLLSCLLCIFAPTIQSMIIARFIQGIGVCSLMIAGYATIHEYYDDQKAIRIIALMGALTITAPMVGPLLGGLLLQFFQWQAIFWVIFVFALFSLSALFITMPESNKNKTRLNFKEVIGQYKNILSNQLFMRYTVVYSLLYSAITVWIGICPFILMEYFGLSTIEFGISQIPIYASFIIGTQLLRFFINKFSQLSIVVLGVGLATLSLAALLISSLLFVHMPFTIATMALFSFGFGFCSAPLNRLIFTASDEKKGAVTAIFYTSIMMLGSLFTLIMSYIYDNGIYSFAGLTLAIMIIALILILKDFHFHKSPLTVE